MDVPRTREDVANELESITDQINQGVEGGKYTWGEVQEAVMSRTRDAAESTDRMVHENPWAAIGIAIGLGVIVGMLLPRR